MEHATIALIILEDASIEFVSTFRKRGGFDDLTIEFPVDTTITSAPMPAERMVNELVTPLEALLWTATGRHSDMKLWLATGDDQLKYQRLWVSLLRPRAQSDPTARLWPGQLLFLARDMPGGIEEGVRRWFDRWTDLRPVLGPVIARNRAPFTYADDRFSAVVAALEEYSRAKHGEREITKADRNTRIRRVEDALEQNAPDLIEWVKEALYGSHRYSLKTRINRLMNESGGVSQALFGEDRDKVLEDVVTSRVQLAHGLARVGGIEGGGRLHWTFRGLSWLLRYHLLLELGFPPDDADARIMSNHEFRAEANRLRISLQPGRP